MHTCALTCVVHSVKINHLIGCFIVFVDRCPVAEYLNTLYYVCNSCLMVLHNCGHVGSVHNILAAEMCQAYLAVKKRLSKYYTRCSILEFSVILWETVYWWCDMLQHTINSYKWTHISRISGDIRISHDLGKIRLTCFMFKSQNT